MILNNREKKEPWNIREDWYKNRTQGLSAMIRVKDEEETIGACIESILPFFDEIIIALDSGFDRTFDIIESFKSKKIKVYSYPFELREIDGVSNPDSLHDRAYYSNWALSKTNFDTVAKWDADMIMLKDMYIDNINILAMKKNIIRLCGYNPVSLEPFILSKRHPIDQYEIRFFKVKPQLYFIQNDKESIQQSDMLLSKAQFESFTYDKTGVFKVFNPINWLETSPWLHHYRINNFIMHKDVYIKKPMFIHTKYIKKNLRQDRKTIWYKEALEQGETINITLPYYTTKKLEDYLCNQ